MPPLPVARTYVNFRSRPLNPVLLEGCCEQVIQARKGNKQPHLLGLKHSVAILAEAVNDRLRGAQ